MTLEPQYISRKGYKEGMTKFIYWDELLNLEAPDYYLTDESAAWIKAEIDQALELTLTRQCGKVLVYPHR